jgi:aryl-alcohol dehydrogenase-like predicted oxidoreductase
LPERGFAEALERGVDLYFWEPIYLTQTRFFASLPKSKKSKTTMCCGTFEASVRGLRRDVEKALKAMGLEQIGVFFVFWVRDRERLSDELLREMDRLRGEGLVGAFGVSTHSRELARGFVEEWPVVMVRHNAAHRGAEREVFPYVDRRRAGLITFSNLCYGRMISELPGWGEEPPSARDAYRYTLSHEAVSACWSAPSTVAQLRENLSALDAGPMSEEELARLRAYGRALYRRNVGFDRFVRRR